MKLFTWYSWCGQKDEKEILTFITNSDSGHRFGSGFRFIKLDSWKFDCSKRFNYVMTNDYNKEAVMNEYDYPRKFFMLIFNEIFTSDLDKLF